MRTQLGLDEVILMVANDPWQKSDDRDVTPAAIRLEMTKALVDNVDGVSVSDQEIVRGGPTYTVETLEEMLATTPGTEIFLVVGQDTAQRIPTWHRSDDLSRLSTLVVVNRSFAPTTHVVESDGKVIHVNMVPIDVSSTAIRHAVETGQSIAFGTSDAVASLIKAHKLYESAT